MHFQNPASGLLGYFLLGFIMHCARLLSVLPDSGQFLAPVSRISFLSFSPFYLFYYCFLRVPRNLIGPSRYLLLPVGGRVYMSLVVLVVSHVQLLLPVLYDCFFIIYKGWDHLRNTLKCLHIIGRG